MSRWDWDRKNSGARSATGAAVFSRRRIGGGTGKNAWPAGWIVCGFAVLVGVMGAGRAYGQSGGPPGGLVQALAIDPSNPATLYAGTQSGGVFKSTNGGTSWTATNSGLTATGVFAVAIDPSNPSTLYTVGGGVFKSTNGGASWTAVNSGIPIGSVFDLAIDPSTPSTVYVGTYSGGVYKSTNGGATWTLSGLGNREVRTLAIDPTAPTTLYAWTTFAGNPTGVYKSIDGGTSWTAVNSGLPNTVVRALAIDPSTSATLYAGTFGGGVFKSTNGAASWAAVNSGLPAITSVHALAIDPSTSATLYAGISDGGVFKSTNGGTSWTSANSGLSNTNVFVLAIDPATPATLYAGTDLGGVFKSTNGGASWQPTGASEGNGTPPATTITKVGGDNQKGGASQTLRYPFVVVVTNASGIPVAGVTVNFAVTAGGGTVLPTSVVTDDQGVALSGLTLGPNLGTNTVTASASGLIGSPVTFTATTPPTVTINQPAGQADPANTSPINFTVVFSEAVTGFTAGSVTLSGTAGATTATVTGGPATYNVAVSGMTALGTVAASISAGAATGVTSGSANLASTSTDNTVTFDNVPPTVTINQAATQADPTSSSPINFTVIFSEPVTGFTSGDVTITGIAAGAATVTVTGGPSTYNVAVGGFSGSGTLTATIGAGVVTDFAGNPNSASTSNDNQVTFGVLSVTINQKTGQADPTNNSPINFTAVFSEAVTGFTNGDVTITGTLPGTKTVTVTGGPATYNVAVSGMTGVGTVIASIPAGVAVSGTSVPNLASTSTDNTVTFDNAPPTVTINQAATQADPTAASPINFTAVFSEPVTGFTSGDVTITGTVSGSKTVAVTGGPTTYNVAVSGMTVEGTVIASIGAGLVTDLAGNLNTASTSTDNQVAFGTPPTVTINQAAGQADPTDTSPINFTVVFNKAVTGFGSGGVTVSGTAPGTMTATVTGGPSTYNVAISGMAGSGSVIAAVNASAATGTATGIGNLASSSTDNVVTFISPATYLVGDAFPAGSDTVGGFGDGVLNNLDLIYALRAVTNVPGFTPAACSDRFDAMDSFPVDTDTVRGGDGVLNNLDLIRMLRRITNIDTSRPVRAARGVACPAPAVGK